MDLSEELKEIYETKVLYQDLSRKNKSIVWDKIDFIFDFIKIFSMTTIFALLFSMMLSLFLIGVIGPESFSLDVVFYSVVGVMFVLSLAISIHSYYKNEKDKTNYLKELEGVKVIKYIEDKDDNKLSAINNYRKSLVESLLSNSQKMNELYKNVEQKTQVYRSYKNLIKEILDYNSEKKKEKQEILNKFIEKGHVNLKEGGLEIQENNG